LFFGGIQKTSLIDYPGKMSCVLFLPGCNFTCPYCHNPELARGDVPASNRIRPETAFAFLEKRRGMLEGVVLSGGEPTISSEIAGLCAHIKKLDYPVKLDTNGSRPDTLARLFDSGCVDYVAMDIKAPPALYAPVITKQDMSGKIEKSIHIIMSSGLDYEFRTTCANPVAGPDTILDIAKSIQGARKYVLQKLNPTTVLDPDFFKRHRHQPERSDLEKMRKMVSPLVKSCIIR